MNEAATRSLVGPVAGREADSGKHGLRGVLGAAAWRRLPEAVRERFAENAADVTYAGAFEIVRASVLGRLFAWLGALFGRPVATRVRQRTSRRVCMCATTRQGVDWIREYRWAGGTDWSDPPRWSTPMPRLIEKLPARLCMPLLTYEERGALHFVSQGYYFDLGSEAALARLLHTRCHARRTHRPRTRLVPLYHGCDAPGIRRDVLPDRSVLRHGGWRMSMRGVLITGASGFIGRHVVRMCAARGWSAWAWTRDVARTRARLGAPGAGGWRDSRKSRPMRPSTPS